MRDLNPERGLKRMPSSSAPRVLFVSKRIFLLRGITALLVGQVALVCWLVSLAPEAEWRDALGETFWWMLPAGLIGLSLILPLSLFWLHGRYVLRLEMAEDNVLITTFLLWGRRKQVWDRHRLSAALVSEIPAGTRREVGEFAAGTALRFRLPSEKIDIVFDRQSSEFPEGEDRVVELFQKT